jgi:hypothetical protein
MALPLAGLRDQKAETQSGIDRLQDESVESLADTVLGIEKS